MQRYSASWRRLPALAWAAAAALAPPAAAQERWARFDGGVETGGGVGFHFSRPATAHLPGGVLVPPHQPRFLPDTLLCATPESQTLQYGLSINAIAAGGDGTGQTVFLLNTSTYGRFSVHVGERAVERAILEDNWDGVYQLLYNDPSKDGMPNLIRSQFGVNGGTADVPGMAFAMTNGGAVHHGLIVLGCDVHEGGGGQWASRRAGLAYTTVDRLAHTDPWIMAAVGEQTSELDAARGSPWSFSPFPISQDELIVVWTDYRTTAKRGGIAYATRFVRTGGEWAAQTIRVDRSDTPIKTEHWHCGGYIRHPDGRDSILISVGDGIADNRLIASTRAAGGAWASPTPVEGTGVDDRSLVFYPSGDWSAPAVVWGGQSIAPYLRHNQAISMIAADPAFGELLCGTDESAAAVLALRYDPDARVPIWETRYLPAATSWAGDGVLNFSMQGMPGGPYLGRIDAASTSPWQANQRETRVLYSPDGVHWGQCMVAGTSGSRQAVVEGEVGYIGSLAGDAVGFRRVGLPVARLVRPLAISPSGTNWLNPSMSAPTQRVDSGVVIEKLPGVTGLPAGVPPPPCDAGNIFRVVNRSYFGRLGLWRPVSETAESGPSSGPLLLRAWLYALGPEGPLDPHTTAQVAAQFYDAAQPGRMDVWTNRMDFESGAWTPLTVWADWTPLSHEHERLVAPSWLPTVYLRAERQMAMNALSRFLIAWEGVYASSPTVQGFGLPPGGTGAEESAVLDGFGLDGEWTMVLWGMIPEDQWDNRVGGSGPNGLRTASDHLPQLFALESADGEESLRVVADVPLEGVRLQIDDGTAQHEAQHAQSVYWLRGSPVLCVLRCGQGSTTLDYSVGGSAPLRLVLPAEVAVDRVRLGPDAMWWHSVEAIPLLLQNDRTGSLFLDASLRCPADYTDDGLIDSRDIIEFLNLWSAGDPRADFNSDLWVDSRDMLAFLNAFADGC